MKFVVYIHADIVCAFANTYNALLLFKGTIGSE